MTRWEKEKWLNKHGWISSKYASSKSVPVMIWAPTGSTHEGINSVAIMGGDKETLDHLYEAIKNKLFYRCGQLVKNRAQ